MWKIRSRSGFTLIELLVTMGVLAVVSAGIVSLIGAGPRQTARDSRRMADLEAIRSGLELARNEIGGYPTCSSGSPCQPSSITNISTYMQTVPTDPVSGRNYSYVPSSCSGGRCSTYMLCTALEKTTTGVAGCSGCGSTCSYAVRNP